MPLENTTRTRLSNIILKFFLKTFLLKNCLFYIKLDPKKK